MGQLYTQPCLFTHSGLYKWKLTIENHFQKEAHKILTALSVRIMMCIHVSKYAVSHFRRYSFPGNLETPLNRSKSSVHACDLNLSL